MPGRGKTANVETTVEGPAPDSTAAAPQLTVGWRELATADPAPQRSRSVQSEPRLLVSLLEAMIRVRRTDRALWTLSQRGVIGVYTPMYGQEAVQAGATLALAPSDWMAPTFRELGAQICRQEPIEQIILFHMGFEEGSVTYSRNLPFAAPVASQLPHAAGLAWAAQIDDEPSAVLAWLGDGATSKGDFHEALNLAGVLELPLVLLCQNNQWALSTPLHKQTASVSLAQKASAYGVRGAQVDGDDVASVYWLTHEALQCARRGGGPTLIEAVTTRRSPHSTTDDPRRYGAEAPADVPDPIDRFRAVLQQAGLWDDAREQRHERRVDEEIEAALQRAEQRRGALRFEDTFEHVHAELPPELVAQRAQAERGVQWEPSHADAATVAPLVLSDAEDGPSLTMAQAINRALGEEMDRDEDVVLLGQDVGKLGGVFRITKGLLDRFGDSRVVDTPLSESAIVGAGIGLALAGKRPVCEIQFAGFLLAAYDQMRNHAGRFRSRTRSQHTVPLLIRAPYGAAVRAPESHSDSVEMIFVRAPGIKVVVPSSPRRARALLKAALRDPDPVLFLEPIPLYRTLREAVPEDDEPLPLGRCLLLRRGRDVTIATFGAMVPRALQAAELAQGDGVDIEVIDLMTLSPLDTATLAQSAHKTGHLLVVHEGCRAGDIAAEILARLHHSMDSSFRFDRVCGWDTGLPHHGREQSFVPSVERIRDAVLDLLLRA